MSPFMADIVEKLEKEIAQEFRELSFDADIRNRMPHNEITKAARWKAV
jgi:hypothetical protein